MKLGSISLAFAAIVFSTASWQVRSAENAPPVVGTWRVTSYSLLTLDTNEVSRPYGNNPIGYIQYSPGFHMVVFLQTGDPKKPTAFPFTEAERVEMHKGNLWGLCRHLQCRWKQGYSTCRGVLETRLDWRGPDPLRRNQ